MDPGRNNQRALRRMEMCNALRLLHSSEPSLRAQRGNLEPGYTEDAQIAASLHSSQ